MSSERSASAGESAQTEEVACGVCGASEGVTLFRATDRRFRVDEIPYGIRRCARCQHVYLSPRPTAEQLGRYYPRTFYSYRLTEGRSREEAVRAAGTRENVEKLALLERHARTRGLLLDVGCAAGDFLELARAHGWQVAGVEFDPEVSRWVREARSIPVASGSIETVEFPAGLAACTFWASLEHLPDPGLALRRVHDALVEEGLLLALVPNFAAWEARMAGRYWPHLDVPRHLHHFTPGTLSQLLRTSGFERISVTTPATTLAATQWHSVLTRGWRPPMKLERALQRSLAPVSGALSRLAASAGRNHSLLAVAWR